MRVISVRRLREFWEKYPAAKGPLKSWVKAVKSARWRNPGELKRTFGTADFVGDLTVFDVGGNKWRLIAHVAYQRLIVYIKHVLTHKEYDEETWKKK